MRNILVIDASLSDFQLAQSILGYAGYRLKHCQELSQFNRLVSEELPDIMLLEMSLPNKSFFAMMLELKSSNIIGGVPVVAVSAQASAANRGTAMTLGAVEFVAKPYNFAELLASIQKIAK